MVVKIIQQIFLSHNKEDDDAGKKIGENSSVSGKQNQTDFFIHNKDDDAEKKIGGSTNKISFLVGSSWYRTLSAATFFYIPPSQISEIL